MMPRTPGAFNDPKLSSAFSLQDYMVSQFNQQALSDMTIDISALVEGKEMQRIQDKRNLEQMLRERSGAMDDTVSKAAKRE